MALTELNSGVRLKKAVMKFAMFFAVALVSVFIPVAHFVLVPLFLLLSVVFFFLEFKKKYHFVSENVPCIHCKKEFKVDDFFSELSARVFCIHCGSQNSIDLK